MTTHASLDPAFTEVMPGEESVSRLTLRNTSDIVEGYQLDVVGDAEPWSRVEPPSVRLFPGDETVVNVVFAPPRTGLIPASDIPYAVRAIPSEKPDQAVAPEGMLRILPFSETTAEVIPRTSRGRILARHEVAIDNRGNVPLTATLTGLDSDRQVNVRLRPSTLMIGPGQAAFSTVSVRNKRRLWRGQPVNHPFQIVIDSDDQSRMVLDATTLQIPVFPRGMARILAAAVALLIALAGVWFLLLRPAVQSAAKDANRDQIAQVAQKADDTAKKVETLSGGGGGPSPSPSTPSAAVVQVTSSAAAASAVRARVQTEISSGTTQLSTPYTVPAKTTLIVTDIVLQNPQGDTGWVEVLVDGQPILTHALQNFRDLDLHFVSPIEIPAGKLLRIRTDCQTPGPPLAGAAANRCRIWMFASGKTVPSN